MFLFFASADFFQTGADTEYCLALGTFEPIPIAKPGQIPTHDGSILYSSYEVALNLEAHNCAGIVDADKWGADGEDLWGPFQGAHFGYGWGPLTPYLQKQWTQKTIDEYGPSMVASYIAINDATGAWVGEDWTTGFLWEWDPVLEELVADANNYLIPIDASGTPAGANLPEGYMRSFAYWYQDFPLMDFSNLTDGAP
jgi:hypothetical protein